MNDLEKLTKKLFQETNKEDKYFLGRAPSINNISKEIKNYNSYKDNAELKGRRINMGEVIIDNLEVIGYNSFVITNNARATATEKKYMDMGNKLNYFHQKKILVEEDHREKGIGTKFIKDNLEIAKKLNKHYIMDVERNNYNMINILSQYEFEEDFNWTDSKGREMIRFFHD